MTEPEIRELHDPERRSWDSDGPRPVRVYTWRPERTTAGPPPLVLLSHGTGGSARDLGWLAEPLTDAGYLVAGCDHHGNNYLDGYLPEGFTCGWERPRDLSFVLDRLTRREEFGPVGAAGFSLGGYTAAALVGARLAPERVRAVGEGRVPLPPLPEFPDLLGALRAKYDDAALAALLADCGADRSDHRVRAAYLICPGIGELVDEASLARVHRPVAVRWGGSDVHTPAEQNALRYAEHIPGAELRPAGDEVTHYQFVRDEPGAAAVRAAAGQDVLAFFRRRLG
ncbi:alpha/beta hydrolase family protein [Streptomyces sp. NPDC092296]|uniref:alpha/beta hydrolase family protein n=1 Tax=Streptomyces sp. NPDC092296 TaxID=3366012 RepID=UPI00382E4167